MSDDEKGENWRRHIHYFRKDSRHADLSNIRFFAKPEFIERHESIKIHLNTRIQSDADILKRLHFTIHGGKARMEAEVDALAAERYSIREDLDKLDQALKSASDARSNPMAEIGAAGADALSEIGKAAVRMASSSIERPPAHRFVSLLQRMVSKKVFDRYFQPAVADYRTDIFKAMAEGDDKEVEKLKRELNGALSWIVLEWIATIPMGLISKFRKGE